MNPRQSKKLTYLETVRLVRNHETNHLHYVKTIRLGYKINDTFGVFRDMDRNGGRFGQWEVIHLATGASVYTTNTLKSAILIAYAFLLHDMQHATLVSLASGDTQWNDQDARQNARQTWIDLRDSYIK